MSTAERSYLREKLEQADPDVLVTTRFAPAPMRRPAAALHALRAEWFEILGRCSDPGVAQAKLGWWVEEIGRLEAGQARHPVTRLLAPLLADDSARGRPQPDFAPALERLVYLAGGGGWNDMDAFVDAAGALGRPLAALEARLAGLEDAPDGLWRDIMAEGLVCDLPRWWQAGRHHLPLDVAAHLAIRTPDLAHAAAGERASAELARRVLARFSPPGTAVSHASIYHDLARERLRRVARGNAPAPGSLRRLWVAWGAARRVARRTAGASTDEPPA